MLLTLADVPWPADAGKRLRAAATVDGLGRVADLDVLVLASPVAGAVAPSSGEGLPDRVAHVDVPLRSPILAAASVLARRVPWQIAVRRWSTARRAVELWGRDRYDLVWFGSLDHAVSLDGRVAADHVVVDADDVETAKLTAFLALPRQPGWRGALDRVQRRVELPLWRGVQARVGRRADAVVVCSDLDRERIGAPRVGVVPNVYPDPELTGGRARRSPPPGDRPVLLMVANYTYEPNADAARCAASVLANLRETHRGAVLRLVGRGEDRLADLAAVEGIDVVGHVAAVDDELAGATLVLAPIRYGGGTRLKVLEAFARRVPVVSTPLGCEGIDGEAGVHLEVAEDVAGLADACRRLVEGPERAAALATSARRLYEERYRPDAARSAIAGVLAEVLVGVDFSFVRDENRPLMRY